MASATGTQGQTVSVTGAGGAVGRSLVQRLLARGLRVRALVIDDAEQERVRALGAEPVRGDVRDPASLAALVGGSDAVFHLAAWIMKPADPALATSINVHGTRNVVRAAARAGCRRVVLASSIAVYGPRLEGVLREDTPFWSVGDPYGDSKIEAERVAAREAAAGGVELVILRPTLIYGPASLPWMLTPFGLIARGLPAVIGDSGDLADPVYVDDVAHAFELAGFAPDAAGEAFNIGAGAPVTWDEFFGHYARMAGTKLRRLPAKLVKATARVSARVAKRLGKIPRTIPEMVGVMTSRATFPIDKARRLLGWAPEVTLAEGMRRTEAWLKEEGLLQRPTVALVTGAGSGLGRATARELRARGLTVWATGVHTAKLAPLEQEGIHTLQMDVASDASIARALEEIERASGLPDVVVNVAGVLLPGPLEVQPIDEVVSQLEVNALGPLRVARAVSAKMRRRGWGRIVNVSSTNGFIATPFMGAYAASKHALEALSDALRMELGPFGVDVVLVQPAAMSTGIAERARARLRAAWQRDVNGWKSFVEAFIASPIWGDQMAEPVERIARLVARAALAPRPPARTRALQAGLVHLASAMPSPIMDLVLERVVGLDREAATRARRLATAKEAATSASSAA